MTAANSSTWLNSLPLPRLLRFQRPDAARVFGDSRYALKRFQPKYNAMKGGLHRNWNVCPRCVLGIVATPALWADVDSVIRRCSCEVIHMPKYLIRTGQGRILYSAGNRSLAGALEIRIGDLSG